MKITLKTYHCYIILTLLCLSLYLPGIGNLPIVDRDAPHFAQATRQMVQTNNFAQVKFQTKPRHLKPPGIYWFQSIFVKAFGNVKLNNVWPYRIASLLGGLFATLLTFMFARRIYGDKIALLAGAILASCLLLVIESHLIVTDSTLLATIVMMQGGLWLTYTRFRAQQPVAWQWPALFWLGMALGILIKGVAPIFALLTIITLAVADRNAKWLRATRYGWGVAFLILFTLAWLIPVSIAGDSNFLLDMIRGDVLPKLAGGQQSHGMPPGYFAFVFTLMFWPSSILFWYAANWAVNQRGQSAMRFLLAWYIPSWIFFEMIPTKLPQYVLPIFPAIAIAMAGAVYAGQANKLNKPMRIINYIYFVIWAMYGIGLAALFYYLPIYTTGHISWFALFAIAVLLISGGIAIYLACKQRLMTALKILIPSMILIIVPLYHFVLPNLKSLWVSRNVAYLVQQKASEILSDKTPLLSVGYGEPSLVFELNTKQVVYASAQQAIARILMNKAGLILVDERQSALFLKLAKQHNIKLSLIGSVSGYNFSHGRWVKLYLYGIQHE